MYKGEEAHRITDSLSHYAEYSSKIFRLLAVILALVSYIIYTSTMATSNSEAFFEAVEVSHHPNPLPRPDVTALLVAHLMCRTDDPTMSSLTNRPSPTSESRRSSSEPSNTPLPLSTCNPLESSSSPDKRTRISGKPLETLTRPSSVVMVSLDSACNQTRS